MARNSVCKEINEQAIQMGLRAATGPADPRTAHAGAYLSWHCADSLKSPKTGIELPSFPDQRQRIPVFRRF